MSYIIAQHVKCSGPESIVPEELFEEYRFDETSGDILIGYRNGHNGIFATGTNKPTRIPGVGVRFNVDDYITLPDEIRNLLSISNAFTVIFAGMLKANTVLSSVKAADDRLNINITTAYPKIIRGNLFKIINYNKADQEFDSNAFNVFTYASTPDGEKAKFFINGDSFRNGITASSAGTTLGCRIGLRPIGSIGLEGTLCYMLFYTRFLSDSEVQKNYRVIRKILKIRGVVIG